MPDWPVTDIKSSSYLRGRIGWQGLRADEFIEEGPFLVTGTDFIDGSIDWDVCYHVTEERYEEGSYIHLKDGDILITKDGTIGKVAYVTDCPEKAVLNSGIFLLRCADGSYDHRYMYHVLRSRVFEEFLEDNLAGSTIKHLYQHIFERFQFPIPEYSEQCAISEFLDLIESAVDAANASIFKQQRIKTGLMQELLTKGIDESGQIRSEETHEFRDSQVGRIPEHWSVATVDELLADVDPAMRSGPFGSALLKSEFVESGIPVLGIDNVHRERFEKHYSRFVTAEKAAELARYFVRPNDVMISIMGTVGRSCVVPIGIGRALSSKHVWTLTFDPEIYSPALACWQFNYAPWVQRHFLKDVQGGIMSAIRSETLRNTIFPVPPRDELDRIETMLKGVSDGIETSEGRLNKLRHLRDGLMQDIMSGKVRTNSVTEPMEIAAGASG